MLLRELFQDINHLRVGWAVLRNPPAHDDRHKEGEDYAAPDVNPAAEEHCHQGRSANSERRGDDRLDELPSSYARVLWDEAHHN